MKSIPRKVRQLITKEHILIVGSSNKGICNVSPRISFHLDDDGSIYWLEMFRHKTSRNLQKNPWCTIAVFDKRKLVGYQLKGKAIMITDGKIKKQVSIQIIDILTRLHKQGILAKTKKRPSLVKFTPKIIFSLNPNELADSALAVNADDESLKASDLQW